MSIGPNTLCPHCYDAPITLRSVRGWNFNYFGAAQVTVENDLLLLACADCRKIFVDPEGETQLGNALRESFTSWVQHADPEAYETGLHVGFDILAREMGYSRERSQKRFGGETQP